MLAFIQLTNVDTGRTIAFNVALIRAYGPTDVGTTWVDTGDDMSWVVMEPFGVVRELIYQVTGLRPTRWDAATKSIKVMPDKTPEEG